MSEINRSLNAEYTAGFLDKAQAPEVLADPQSRKEFILNLDYQAFENWLIRINGMARGLTPR
jgi:hypothetical protein